MDNVTLKEDVKLIFKLKTTEDEDLINNSLRNHFFFG